MPGCWSALPALRQPLCLLCWVACATSVAATRERSAVKNVAGPANVTGASGFIAVKTTSLSEDEDLRSHDKAALQELTSVAQDLEAAKAHDHKELSRIEQQIVGLVHQRDAAKKDEKRKVGEIAFLEDEIGRVKRRLTVRTGAAATTASADTAAASAASASASANYATAASSSAEGDVATADASAGASAGASSDSSELAEAEAAASEADKVIQAVDSSSSLRGAATAQASTAEVAKSAAETAAEEENRRLRAELDAEKAKAAAEERAKEEQVRAEVEAKERAKAEAEAKEKAKRDAEEAKEKAARDAELAAEKEKKDKQDEMTNSVDDSFKNFMKEEDGEEDQGDPEYEDSANALAGAIGWDRKAVEANADNGIKQLTEAIGGKKVVQSLQGMMAGIGR